jgi:hypothetical protein
MFAMAAVLSLGGGFVGMGSAGARETWLEWPLAKASAEWPHTAGTVTTVRARGRRARKGVRVEYQYDVHGSRYTSRRVEFMAGLFSEAASNFGRQLSAGDTVVVRYDPAQPREAVLIAGASTWRFATAMLLSLALMAFGVIVLARGVPSLWEHAQSGARGGRRMPALTPEASIAIRDA